MKRKILTLSSVPIEKSLCGPSSAPVGPDVGKIANFGQNLGFSRQYLCFWRYSSVLNVVSAAFWLCLVFSVWYWVLILVFFAIFETSAWNIARFLFNGIDRNENCELRSNVCFVLLFWREWVEKRLDLAMHEGKFYHPGWSPQNWSEQNINVNKNNVEK